MNHAGARPRRRGAQSRWRERRGVVSVEAALAIALVLIPLCLGVIGLGMAMTVAVRLDRAVQAAVYYAWANQGTALAWGSVGSTSLAGAQNAAVAAYGTVEPAATITASVGFYCVSGGYVPVQPAVTNTTACPAGESLATYLTIATSTSVTPPGMPNATAIPLSVTGTVRVQ
ncbi:MAG TPA: hypothetical protein VMB34_20340 [Acetobacteraceae bacterium]|nr:hypothetical protein [Acetobacteraceae bacterium]